MGAYSVGVWVREREDQGRRVNIKAFFFYPSKNFICLGPLLFSVVALPKHLTLCSYLRHSTKLLCRDYRGGKAFVSETSVFFSCF